MFIEKQYLIISIVIFVFLLILLFYYIYKSHKLEQLAGQAIDSLKYRFDDDSEFLLHIISYKCAIYINSTFKTKLELNENGLLKGQLLTDAVNEIVLDVLNSISLHYKNVLMKYFTKKSLNTYITEIVMETMIKLSRNLNQDKITNIYNFTTNNNSQSKEDEKKKLEFNKKDIE